MFIEQHSVQNAFRSPARMPIWPGSTRLARVPKLGFIAQIRANSGQHPGIQRTSPAEIPNEPRGVAPP